MELNKYFFEALRLRLENILRALSNNRKAHIVYSTSIATDVKNTVYLQARDYIEPNVKPALAELLLFYKACVSHEGAHIRFTSCDDWKEACSRGPVFQHLTNIIEDGRIEAAISQTLPGAGRWIKFTNQYIYNHRKPETYGTGLQAFLMGLNIYSVLQTVPFFLSSKTQKLIKLAAPHVDIGRAASTTKEVLGCVEEILAIPEIKSLIDASTPPLMIEGDKGTTSPEETTPSKETSERAEKAKKIIQRRKPRNENSNQDKSSHKKESSDKAKKESDKVNSKDSENAGSQDTECSKDASDNEDTDISDTEHALENPDNNQENNDSQEQNNDETLSDTDETDNASSDEETSELDEENDIEDEDTSGPDETLINLDEDNDSNNRNSESSEESDNDLSEALENLDGELEGSSNDFDGDASEDVPEENPDQSDNDLPDSDFDSENFEAGDFEVELDLESYENDDSEFENGASETLDSETSHGNLSYDEDEEEFFANPPEEDFEELLEDTSEEVLTLTKEAENIEEKNNPEDILQGIPVNIHGGIKLYQRNLRRNPSVYQTLKKHNTALVKNLVNEIQVALETRKAYDLRSLNRGRLHSGSLWKLAVPDPTVFSRRVIPGDIPGLAVYILVDLSGSMDISNISGGPTRIKSVKNATCVLSEAMRELKIVHAITGFQADYPKTYHYPAVTWDDIDSVKIASFKSTCCNRDGYSLRIAANELSYRQEPKKVLFILSDGQPHDFNGYANDTAWNDVKQAVFETKQKGIKVISLFFGDEYCVPAFKFMYDTPVFVPNLSILPRALGEVFKKVYLE